MEKNIQNFLAFNNKKGMYRDEIRKHDKPHPKQTTKPTNLWLFDNLKLNLFQILGPSLVTLSSFNDLKEYCENMDIVIVT